MNKNKILLAALLASLYGFDLEAQTLSDAPRLVVNITIDQLRSDYLEQYAILYKQNGFRRLLKDGRVYESVVYPFSPVDQASAITCIATGTTPQYNKISARQWLNRKTLRPEYCVSYDKGSESPDHIATSTIGDELKIATDGRSMVFSFAKDEYAAILAGGHAADGAFWIDEMTKGWTTSAYYFQDARSWINNYQTVISSERPEVLNEVITDQARRCINDKGLGRDEFPDYLTLTLSACLSESTKSLHYLDGLYSSLDNTIGNFIDFVEQKVGKDKVLFVITATGDTEDPVNDYKRYNIPTGTYYINRGAHLLNMYLGAIYGSGNWVEGFDRNQIYLNHKLIEDKKVSYSDIIQRSKDLLQTTAGVVSVSRSPYDTEVSGDIWVEVNPGWTILNEETNTSYQPHTAFVPFPVIFLGSGIRAEHIETLITTDRIAPTISKCIHIRAPNACKERPLF